MKPLSERDENFCFPVTGPMSQSQVGMKPLSERDENFAIALTFLLETSVGMKPLSERDENKGKLLLALSVKLLQ